jgi:hypothetical protein
MLAVAGAGPARATPLTPTPFPLEGSTFEGADGDQAHGSSTRDWHAVEAEGSLVHREDVNADDTAFVGGSKENRPFEWDLGAETSGVSPASVNIRDAWGTIEQVNGSTFLQLAFSREASGGTEFLAFELNQDRRLWNNGQARIPCRRDGDVQIAYEPQGDTVEVQLRR